MIYIHVGFPKTASTTIQYFLAANAEQLKKHGRLYPKLTADRSASYGVNPEAHNPLAVELRRGEPGPTWARLHKILKDRSDGMDIVLSGEALAACKPPAVRQALGTEPTTIIFYIREYAKIVVSQYAHRTKIGSNTDDFDAFAGHQLRGRSRKMADQIGGWAETFGAKNVKVRQLDKRTLAEGDVRLDVLDAIGLDASAIDVRNLEMTEDANVSPGWKTLEILRDLNRTMSKKFVSNSHKGALAKAKMDRRRRTESPLLDFTAFIWRPAAKIGKQMGFADRGLYMSRELYEQCNAVFDEQVDALKALDVDARIAPSSRDSFVPRAFMPSIEEIPAEEIAMFLRRLAPAGWWTLISGEKRVGELIKRDDDGEDAEEAS